MGTFEPSDADGVFRVAPESESALPEDFTADEADFAAELRGIFSLEREDLPPLYAQTLAGDVFHRPLESGFEQKLTYRIFRRLHLSRSPLFQHPPETRRWGVASAVVRRLGPVGAAAAAFVFGFMVLSVLVASPSFAQGLRILLAHTGVQQVASYPTVVRPSASMVAQSGHSGSQGDHMATNSPLNIIEWLGPSAQGYTYQGVAVNAPEPWSDGPIVVLRYARPNAGAGSGVLDVQEFRIAPSLSSVLQVVADGSVSQVTVGNLPGVYVDGRWTRNEQRPTWESGVRSELIFEQDGLIFWIVADQRDGMKQAQLIAAALQLTPVTLRSMIPVHPSLRVVGQELQGALTDPAGDAVLALIPAGSSPSDGPASFVSFAPGLPLLH